MIIKVAVDIKETSPTCFTIRFQDSENITVCLRRIANKAMLKVTDEELFEKYALLLYSNGKYQYIPQEGLLSQHVDEEKIRVQISSYNIIQSTSFLS